MEKPGSAKKNQPSPEELQAEEERRARIEARRMRNINRRIAMKTGEGTCHDCLTVLQISLQFKFKIRKGNQERQRPAQIKIRSCL